MHSSTTGRILVVLAGLMLVACGKSKVESSKTKKTELVSQPSRKAPSVVQTSAASPASNKPAEPAPAPELVAPKELRILVSASANGAVQPTVTAGWPVVVEVQLMLKPDGGASLTLANPKGPWSDAVTLECIGSDGNNHASLFASAYASEKSIELTPTRSGLLVWVLDSVDLKTLPEGTYQIRAKVDERKLGGSIAAGLVSRPIVVTVGSGTATVSAGMAQRKCLAMMKAAAWKHDLPKSLAIASAYLGDHPKDVPVLFVQGKILRAAGKKPEALASFAAALKAAGENKNPMAENFALERALVDLEKEMAAK
jgi:hypothetical protein